MNIKNIPAVLTGLLLFTASCSKFLDVKPKGILIAESVNDYEGILNDQITVYPFGVSFNLVYPSDNITIVNLSPQNQTSVPGNIYFWKPLINNTSDLAPDVWSQLYNSIANLNLVTEEVLKAKDGTEQKRRQLYGEAVVDKAYLYFHLLAFFAPAYDKATADTDYGVPYVTSTDQAKATPPRPTLQVMYDTLINSIVRIVSDLPETNLNNTRVTKYVAYGMLARLYMSMRDYDHALQYADSALKSQDADILDYNNYLAGGMLPETNRSPEELFVRYAQNSFYTYSESLLAAYDTAHDLRIKFFGSRNSPDSLIIKYGYLRSYTPNSGITWAEIYLDKAECLARNGNIAGGLAVVNNMIRKNRFTPADYTPLTAATPEEAIDAILKERRRELAFKGLRWSDMKRLDREGRMTTVQRIAADRHTVLATLEPGSLRYTFQIPLLVQAFNPDMPLNKQ